MGEKMIQLVIKNLINDKFRKLLTIITISISISLVISLISITLGLRQTVSSSLERMGQNVLGVSPNPILSTGFTQKDVETIDKIPEVKDIVSVYITTNPVQRGDENVISRVVGVLPDEKKILIEQGYYEIFLGPTPTKVTNPASLGFSLWKSLGEPHLLERIQIKGIGEYKLESVFKSVGDYSDDFSIFLPMEDVLKYKNITTYSYLIVFVSDPNIKNIIEDNLEKSKGVKDFYVSDNKKKLEDTQTIISLLEWFFVAISTTSIIVSGVGVANTFYIEAAERKNYIGILKALGATEGDVVYIFLIESAVLGGLGGLIGTLFANFTGSIISEMARQRNVFLNPIIPGWLWISSIVLGTLIAVVFAITPAKKASQLDPVEALG